MRIGPFGPLQLSALEIYVVMQDETYASLVESGDHTPFPGKVDLQRGYIEIEPHNLDEAIKYIGDTWDGVTENPAVDADDRRYGEALSRIHDRLVEARRRL
jgi:hypothetical protein